MERPRKFNGRYLILGELNKAGILESGQKLRLNNLKTFISKELGGQAEEIIIATNPTTYGDLSASIITKELAGFAKKITRLGRGIPTGGEIEFADEDTLGAALEKELICVNLIKSFSLVGAPKRKVYQFIYAARHPIKCKK